MTSTVRKVEFFTAYKQLRNNWRRFSPQSITRISMAFMQQPVRDRVHDLQKQPWQVLLLLKWVLQDEVASDRTGRAIAPNQYDALRQKLHDIPGKIIIRPEDGPARLFFRQLVQQQVRFQRERTLGFIREAALLDRLTLRHPLNQLFVEKTGLDVNTFVDLCIASHIPLAQGRQTFDVGWFSPLRHAYGEKRVSAFVALISRTYEQLVAFVRGLPRATQRATSELYEFPVISRYPLLRTGEHLECWHPMVLNRGIEGMVHSILSESGQGYIEQFSKIFESHVIQQIEDAELEHLKEKDLRSLLPREQQVPDALISFPGTNIFVESKAGLFDESVMVVGHPKILADKTKALRTAIQQGWSAASGLRASERTPKQVAEASIDYLLIVTNRELSASNGRSLNEMYPAGKLEYPNATAEQFLPLERVYVLSIDDFERLLQAVATRELNLPEFLAGCVARDSDPQTSLFYFDQHLSIDKVPVGFSKLVTEAVTAAQARLLHVLQP